MARLMPPSRHNDEDIEDTRQIQVDEALKLYQNALKLHAQGPKSYDDASKAYDQLFESAIFKLPEAITEYERAQRPQTPFLSQETAFSAALDVANPDGDPSATSLPQVYYLAYKNHGHFRLDRIRHEARVASREGRPNIFDQDETQTEALGVLSDFEAALDRDPSDAELWRRAARVSAFLKSARVSRYCLEAAIELDDDPAVGDVEPPSLAEGYAGEQLKNQLQVLGDDMALSHPAMGPFVKYEVPDFLKRFLDPLPFLPNPIKEIAIPKSTKDEESLSRLILVAQVADWTNVGLAIIAAFLNHGASGRGVFIEVPEVLEDEQDVVMDVDSELQAQIEAQVLEESRSGSAGSEKPAAATSDTQQTAANTDSTPATKPAADTTSPGEGRKDSTASLGFRKRSQSEAGLADGGDEEAVDSKRPKRARRRDTAVEEVVDPSTIIANQLRPYQTADHELFQLIQETTKTLGINDPDASKKISEILESCSSEDRLSKLSSQVAQDLAATISTFTMEQSKVLLNKEPAPTLGLNAFLEHTKPGTSPASEKPPANETAGLKAFIARINGGWFTLEDCAFRWLSALCHSYTASRWSEERKRAVVHVITRLDDGIYQRLQYESQNHQDSNPSVVENQPTMEALAQMLFELHLDIYERVTNPNSLVDAEQRKESRTRLMRWLFLRSQLFDSGKAQPSEELTLRFCWAVVFATTLSDTVSPDHVLDSWRSLREVVEQAGTAEIFLPNNVVMPEVSVKAVDREISKLTTMDFFLGLFKEDMGDPVAVISSLEPVLNPNSVAVVTDPDTPINGMAQDGESGEPTGVSVKECATQTLQDLWKFVRGSSTDLRLFLWKRLGDAYRAIKYNTMQFSCLLRSIEMIVDDFERESYLTASAETRTSILIHMLRNLDDLLIHALHLALNDNTSFDIIDDNHLGATAAALAKLSCILHVCAIYEDEVSIGLKQNSNVGSSFRKSLLDLLHNFQARTWCLQYCVLKVGIGSNKELFTKPSSHLSQLLAAIHQVLGLRKMCKASNRIFPKMMRVELLRQTEAEDWERDLGQVLYDLHGLKLGVEVEDHGCPPEKLEKRNAIALVEKITILADRMSMKDLLKSELKTTIEHMSQAIGQTKSTPQMIHNLRNFTEYLKKPIHPLRLYQAWKGTVSIDAVTVTTSEAALAEHGWFFLLGMIAFSKFKQVDLNRRQTPGATDDLRIGQASLRSQIQFTPDRWDAWLRLAECYDYELDEAVLWTADKINKDRAELLKFQRSSIHCYSLALSHSYSMSRELSDNDSEALYDLYYNFGMRMYASSREPFGMEPFKHSEQERFFIDTGESENGTYKKILHMEMTDYQVWKYAASLFRKAMARRPKDWKSAYMYSKCLWKMYATPDDRLPESTKRTKPGKELLISALEKAVEVVSWLPKPRHGQDPVIEPHYKILVVLYKLVSRGDMTAQEAADVLQRQPYAVRRGEDVLIGDGDSDDKEEWEEYVIKYLCHLRDKDKSNWQHRMIIRHARILFDSDENGSDGEKSDGKEVFMGAKAAFSVLRESMFTKTMVMNVWKCDAERPGRHHVYTEQYVRFMTRLLVAMDDRVNLEALLRRIRKKGADFYHFNELWHYCVLAYTRLIRQAYQIPTTEEETFKNVSLDEFEIVAERITEWAVKLKAEEHSAFDAMKEAIELKKLNANLTKATPIDDLVSDCYCLIYSEVGSDLPGPPPAQILEDRAKQKEAAAAASAEERPTGLNSFLSALDTKANSSRAGSEAPDKTAVEQSSRPRKAAGVRRPDILRKAEQAVLRAMEPPQAKTAAGASSARAGANGENGRKSRMSSAGSVGGGKTSRMSPGEAEGGGNGGDAEDEDIEMTEVADEDEDSRGPAIDNENDDGADADSEGSSPRGSNQDSTDDESDLSDVPPDYEDNMPASLMFPNLRRSVESAGPVATSDSEAIGSSDEGSGVDEEEEDEEAVLEEEDNEQEDEQDDEQEEDGEEDEEGDGDEEIEEEGGAEDEDQEMADDDEAEEEEAQEGE
ncbi:hypothetical protein MCOR29_004739 [Pyricularia oryzae]|nr:hypothetical protein MCOR19_002235 [Pyricularia oryzae]KAI6322458.1 hypothetical protein MCOR29_004739 [Pyricularia oryzae]KAI6488786.1 hypothetical protein MCOR18_002792 [Pyricularia oryzae]KAI6495792.1 hypothetical protein MCOR13_007145 [Pyricularia oryzae]